MPLLIYMHTDIYIYRHIHVYMNIFLSCIYIYMIGPMGWNSLTFDLLSFYDFKNVLRKVFDLKLTPVELGMYMHIYTYLHIYIHIY
jgi:hypothetical protein